MEISQVTTCTLVVFTSLFVYIAVIILLYVILRNKNEINRLERKNKAVYTEIWNLKEDIINCETTTRIEIIQRLLNILTV